MKHRHEARSVALSENQASFIDPHTRPPTHPSAIKAQWDQPLKVKLVSLQQWRRDWEWESEAREVADLHHLPSAHHESNLHLSVWLFNCTQRGKERKKPRILCKPKQVSAHTQNKALAGETGRV